MPDDENTLKEMAVKIGLIRQNALELKSLSGGIQSIERNLDRLLVYVKILELNISEVISMSEEMDNI